MRTNGWLVAGLAAGILVVGGCQGQPAEAKVGGTTAGPSAGATSGTQRAERTIAVRTTPAAERAFEARVAVKGNVEAQNFAFVGAKIPGILDQMLVDVGDRVVAGETVLFRTERARLEKAVEAGRATLALTKTGIEEKKAVLAQLEVALSKAQADYDRHKKLRATKSVSEDLFERVETGYRQAKAAARHGAVLVDLSRDQARQAEVALSITERDLADTEVVAPLSGVVSQRSKEPGETAAPGMPFLRITDVDALYVSARVPSDHYGRVVPGETPLRARSGDTDLGVLTVSYRSPVIDKKTRTFEVRALLTAPPDGTRPLSAVVAPGALTDIELLLAQRKALGVPQSAVVSRGGANVIFVVEGGTARAKTVQLGLETDGWVELRDPPFAAGAAVISDGQTLVDDGTSVKVLEREAEATSAPVPAGAGEAR